MGKPGKYNFLNLFFHYFYFLDNNHDTLLQLLLILAGYPNL